MSFLKNVILITVSFASMAFAHDYNIDMDAPIVKRDGLGRPISPDLEIAKPADFAVIRDCYRLPVERATDGNVMLSIAQCIKAKRECAASGLQSCSGKAPIKGNDQPVSLIGKSQGVLNKLSQMEELMEASLPEVPWTDDYWPLYRGVLGTRYEGADFPVSENWTKNYEWHIKTNPVSAILASDDQALLDTMSPSEKYDFLVGIDPSSSESLTTQMWLQGKQYQDSSGKVERWMGICHGWAPAAYKVPAAEKEVVVKAADGRKVTFFPGDIRALASYLWGTAPLDTRFVGGRCDVKAPKKDENGRVTDGDCFDTNPGTFHIAVVNMIGKQKESFVMDATYDYEVWNHPIYSYSYKYFNPKTRKAVAKLDDALIDIKSLEGDKFAKYRSPNAKTLVGVKMTVTYVVEIDAQRYYTDVEAFNSATYEYDLELDENGQIIGGEWYNNKHPDFLWTPSDTRAMTYYDSGLSGSWRKTAVVPEAWRQAAKAAASQGQVLGRIVDSLVRASSQNEE